MKYQDEPPAWAQALIADVAALKASMAKLEADPLDALEKELAGHDEDNVTMPAEVLAEKLIQKREREKTKACAAELPPTFDNTESRQAAYDSRNPHKKKRDKTARAGL